MFILLIVAAIAVGLAANEVATQRFDRARLAAGLRPLPAREKPHDVMPGGYAYYVPIRTRTGRI